MKKIQFTKENNKMSIYLYTSLNFQDTEKVDHINKRLKNIYHLKTPFGIHKLLEIKKNFKSS